MASKTQLYREILREYDSIQAKKAAEQRERTQALYEIAPRLKEIEEERSMIGISAAKAVLMTPEHQEEFLSRLKEKQQELNTEQAAIFREKGFAPDILEKTYECPLCGDTGFVEGKPCVCLKKKLLDRLYDQSNIRDIVQAENFDTFDPSLFSERIVPEEGMSPKENMKQNFRKALDFTKGLGKGNLLMYGGTGRGKTFLCNCIAKDMMDHGKTVLYLTAGQLFKLLEDAHFRNRDSETAENDPTEDLLEADLLILDDLGTEFSTVFTSSELFRIINERKLRKKSVVISTNLAYKELMQQYSDRVMSRIIGEYDVMKFFGDDLRMKKKFS